MLVRLEEGAKLPARATERSAGLDLAALEDVTIRPGDMCKVRTGVHAVPDDPATTVGLLFIRSGLSKVGLSLSTGVSVIDGDYTGEILAYVRNDGHDPVTIRKGDRFCQLVCVRCSLEGVRAADALPGTDRGNGGFGSTGA